MKYSNIPNWRVFTIIQVLVLGLVILPTALAQGGTAEKRSGAVASVSVQKNAGKTIGEITRPTAATRTSTPAPERDADQQSSSVKQTESPLENPQDSAEDDGSQDGSSMLPEGEAQLRVRISVPHQVRATSTITLYPYPPRLPKMRKNINKIDDKPKSIRSQLLSIGYTGRSSDTKLFPNAGLRWQYILRAALAKSGTHPPTNILTMYPWTFKMVPYVQAEIRRINEIEADRKVRYSSAVRDYEDNGIDLENEATQKGLSPVELNLKRGKKNLLSGEATVSAGTWYVVAAHKAANVQFFWQIPVTVSAGEHSTVQLTQTNALLIDGVW